MEEKINVAEILKDKPQGTKLYSPICGECKLSYIESEKLEPQISTESDAFGVFYFWDDGKAYNEGECLLFPSDKMRDWAKFAWKKGDILVNKDAKVHIIFDGFDDDTYKNFHGQYYLWEEGGSIVSFEEDENYMQTSDFNKANKEDAQEYIHKIEKELGGNLNMEILEIEKPQPEFKDGDIVVAEGENKGKKIFIFRYKIRDSNTDEHGYKSYINVNSDGSLFNNMTFYLRKDFVYRPATDSEKQQLFEALAKENKVWDAEKKQIVELKKKVELKPFDKVLCRNSKDDTWEADFFARLTRKEIDYTQSGKYLCVGDLWMYCIPYNEETAHLLGTTDDWEGGEHD